jgi:vancomycin resistance protein VanW
MGQMSTRPTPKPIHRSNLRMALGRTYFRFKRWLTWHKPGQNWAWERTSLADHPHVLFQHQTPLLRKLKDVEMVLQQNKVANLAIATRRLDGIRLRPGETLSYWRLIGNPAARHGFLPGLVLHNGQTKAEVGGGLCQLSNLIYWMTLHTPLSVVERWRHNYDVFPDSGRTLPFGSGATCSYNYVDLQVRNETEQSFQLHVYLTETHLVGEWRSDQPHHRRYQVYEAHHEITGEPWGGFTRHNLLKRRVFSEALEQVDDQYITENHAIMMYEPFLQAPPPTQS